MNTAETVLAVQHIRKMRGGSQAHLIRASDNNFFVVKFQNNPQHLKVLANEYLASNIGRTLGLPIPEAKIISVPDSLISQTPELRIEAAQVSVPCARGLQFASRYAADPWQEQVFDYLPISMFAKVSNPQVFAWMLAFDKWAGNCDGRQALFIRTRGEQSYRAAFIDQGYCFNAERWSFPDLPLHGVYYRNHFYQSVTSWNSFAPVLSAIERIEIADLRNIALQIPAEWYQHNSKGLSDLIEQLHNRRSLVRVLITAFRTHSRSPFPNWVAS